MSGRAECGVSISRTQQQLTEEEARCAVTSSQRSLMQPLSPLDASADMRTRCSLPRCHCSCFEAVQQKQSAPIAYSECHCIMSGA